MAWFHGSNCRCISFRRIGHTFLMLSDNPCEASNLLQCFETTVSVLLLLEFCFPCSGSCCSLFQILLFFYPKTISVSHNQKHHTINLHTKYTNRAAMAHTSRLRFTHRYKLLFSYTDIISIKDSKLGRLSCPTFDQLGVEEYANGRSRTLTFVYRIAKGTSRTLTFKFQTAHNFIGFTRNGSQSPSIHW